MPSDESADGRVETPNLTTEFVVRSGDGADRMADTWHHLNYWHALLGKMMTEREGNAVQQGPFAGMNFCLPLDNGFHLTRLIGCYEEELHDKIEAIVSLAPNKIVNVGCGDGYYAVGLALRLPDAEIIGFDMDPAQMTRSHLMADGNGVRERIEFRGECTPAQLHDAIGDGAIVIMDVEGAERELLDLDLVPGLAESVILVEVHDFVHPSLSQELYLRFQRHHAIEAIEPSVRNPNRYASLANLAVGFWGGFFRDIAINEFRPTHQNWLYMTPG